MPQMSGLDSSGRVQGAVQGAGVAHAHGPGYCVHAFSHADVPWAFLSEVLLPALCKDVHYKGAEAGCCNTQVRAARVEGARMPGVPLQPFMTL